MTTKRILFATSIQPVVESLTLYKVMANMRLSISGIRIIKGILIRE